MEPLDCIAFMLIKDNKILAERRRLTKKVVPGKVAIPGGHMEKGENPKDALLRELNEEVRIIPDKVKFVCTLLHKSEEFRKLNYFAIESWKGEIQNNEAEELIWIPLKETNKLDLDVDRKAIEEYLLIYKNKTFI